MTELLSVSTSRRYGTLSPLRYPGGKAALAGLFADILTGIGIADPTYIEPYAGGAGAGIALLREGLVSKLVINDIDPAVHAFWRAATENNAELVDRVLHSPLDMDEWRVQRDIYRSKPKSIIDLGFAFFYLNRTNRSGVLNAGVIGGNDQRGNYKIDARFNRTTLAERLRAIGSLSAKIEVSDLDGRTVIKRYGRDPCAFLYIDPPYVQAGSQLYLNSFDRRDHEALAKIVREVSAAHWLVTYDTSPLIERLYRDLFQCRLELNYSARHPGRANELLVASSSVGAEVSRLQSLDATVA
ncbi:DNA adenine methylase [Schumannella luteola]